MDKRTNNEYILENHTTAHTLLVAKLCDSHFNLCNQHFYIFYVHVAKVRRYLWELTFRADTAPKLSAAPEVGAMKNHVTAFFYTYSKIFKASSTHSKWNHTFLTERLKCVWSAERRLLWAVQYFISPKGVDPTNDRYKGTIDLSTGRGKRSQGRPRAGWGDIQSRVNQVVYNS